MGDAGVPAQSKRRRLLDAVRQSNEPPEAGGGTMQGGPQHPQHDDPDADLDDVPLPSDVEASFLFLRTEMINAARQAELKSIAKQNKGFGGSQPPPALPPLVLVSQLHSLLKDRRHIEAELETLRRRNVIRMFKLTTGVDEHGVMLTTDYLQWVREAAQAAVRQQQEHHQHLHQQGQQHGPGGHSAASSEPNNAATGRAISTVPAIAELFCTRVVPHHSEVTISQQTLLNLCQQSRPASDANGNPTQQLHGAASQHQARARAAALGNSSTVREGSGQVETEAGRVSHDTVLATLLQLGVVTRHPTDDGGYLLWCPSLGPVIKSVIAGRKELLAFIAKKPHGEVSERALLGNTLTGLQASRPAAPPRPAPASQEGGFLKPLEIEVQLGRLEGGAAGGAGRNGQKGRSVQQPSGGGGGGSSGGAGQGKGSAGIKLKQSLLDVSYHLRDLLGRGDAVRVHTTAGDVIRLVKKG